MTRKPRIRKIRRSMASGPIGSLMLYIRLRVGKSPRFRLRQKPSFRRAGPIGSGLSQNWLPEAYSPQNYPVSKKPFVLWNVSKCLTIRARHGRQKIVNTAAFQTHKTIRDKAAKKPAPRDQDGSPGQPFAGDPGTHPRPAAHCRAMPHYGKAAASYGSPHGLCRPDEGVPGAPSQAPEEAGNGYGDACFGVK